MKKNILLVVCIIVALGVVLYLKGRAAAPLTVADTSLRTTMLQGDVHSAADSRHDSVENQAAQQVISVAPSSGSKQIDLPFEKTLLEGQSLDAAKIQALLQSRKFEIKLDKFANESVADINASELTATYKNLLAAQFKAHDIQANLVKFTCGIETCVGLVRNGTDAEYSRWADVFFPGSRNAKLWVCEQFSHARQW